MRNEIKKKPTKTKKKLDETDDRKNHKAKPLLVLKTKAAFILNVNPSTITRLCANDWKDSDALEKNRINLSSKTVKAYARKSGITLPTRANLDKALSKKKAKKNTAIIPAGFDSGIAVSESDIDAEKYGDWTLTQIVDKFGTMTDFADHLAAVKKLIDIDGKRIDNMKSEGLLIPREIVSRFVFGPMEEIFTRILTDAPQNISEKMEIHFKTKGTAIEGAEMITKILSQLIKSSKRKIDKALADA